MAAAATSAAMIGAKTAGMKTLDATPCQITALPPACTIVAPMTPPIRACEELDGIPRYQVVTFQATPPARPAKTTAMVTSSWLTMPLAMVAATASDRNAPTRLARPKSPPRPWASALRSRSTSPSRSPSRGSRW